jgi:hypothetical protein
MAFKDAVARAETGPQNGAAGTVEPEEAHT